MKTLTVYEASWCGRGQLAADCLNPDLQDELEGRVGTHDVGAAFERFKEEEQG